MVAREEEKQDALILSSVLQNKDIGSTFKRLELFVSSRPSTPQICSETDTAVFKTLCSQALSDLSSSDKGHLQNILLTLQGLANYEHTSDGLDQLLFNGLSELIVDIFNKVTALLHNDIDNVYEDLLETIVTIADYSNAGKLLMLSELYRKILKLSVTESFTIQHRLEAIKAVNNLSHQFPVKLKTDIIASVEFTRLSSVFSFLLENCGDYEYQIGLSECLFRVLSKEECHSRSRHWFTDILVRQAFCSVRDSNFEMDCRKFLNILNKKITSNRSRVFSFPVLSIVFGKYELKKPTESDQFWVDFNGGSRRISFFCSQEDGEEELWDTVIIGDEDVWNYHVESAETIILRILLHQPSRKLLSFGPDFHEPTIVMYFPSENHAGSMAFALDRTFSRNKLVGGGTGEEAQEQAARMKVSAPEHPIYLSTKADDVQVADTIRECNHTSAVNNSDLEMDLMSRVALKKAAMQTLSLSQGSSEYNQGTPPIGRGLNTSTGTPRHKISCPAVPMMTPTRLSSVADGHSRSSNKPTLAVKTPIAKRRQSTRAVKVPLLVKELDRKEIKSKDRELIPSSNPDEVTVVPDSQPTDISSGFNGHNHLAEVHKIQEKYKKTNLKSNLELIANHNVVYEKVRSRVADSPTLSTVTEESRSTRKSSNINTPKVTPQLDTIVEHNELSNTKVPPKEVRQAVKKSRNNMSTQEAVKAVEQDDSQKDFKDCPSQRTRNRARQEHGGQVKKNNTDRKDSYSNAEKPARVGRKTSRLGSDPERSNQNELETNDQQARLDTVLSTINDVIEQSLLETNDGYEATDSNEMTGEEVNKCVPQKRKSITLLKKIDAGEIPVEEEENSIGFSQNSCVSQDFGAAVIMTNRSGLIHVDSGTKEGKKNNKRNGKISLEKVIPDRRGNTGKRNTDSLNNSFNSLNNSSSPIDTNLSQTQDFSLRNKSIKMNWSAKGGPKFFKSRNKNIDDQSPQCYINKSRLSETEVDKTVFDWDVEESFNAGNEKVKRHSVSNNGMCKKSGPVKKKAEKPKPTVPPKQTVRKNNVTTIDDKSMNKKKIQEKSSHMVEHDNDVRQQFMREKENNKGTKTTDKAKYIEEDTGVVGYDKEDDTGEIRYDKEVTLAKIRQKILNASTVDNELERANRAIAECEQEVLFTETPKALKKRNVVKSTKTRKGDYDELESNKENIDGTMNEYNFEGDISNSVNEDSGVGSCQMGKRSRKIINYYETSRSDIGYESSVDVEVPRNSHSKKTKSVFSLPTDEDDTKSEVSWLKTEARKRKAPPMKSYSKPRYYGNSTLSPVITLDQIAQVVPHKAVPQLKNKAKKSKPSSPDITRTDDDLEELYFPPSKKAKPDGHIKNQKTDKGKSTKASSCKSLTTPKSTKAVDTPRKKSKQYQSLDIHVMKTPKTPRSEKEEESIEEARCEKEPSPMKAFTFDLSPIISQPTFTIGAFSQELKKLSSEFGFESDEDIGLSQASSEPKTSTTRKHKRKTSKKDNEKDARNNSSKLAEIQCDVDEKSNKVQEDDEDNLVEDNSDDEYHEELRRTIEREQKTFQCLKSGPCTGVKLSKSETKRLCRISGETEDEENNGKDDDDDDEVAFQVQRRLVPGMKQQRQQPSNHKKQAEYEDAKGPASSSGQADDDMTYMQDMQYGVTNMTNIIQSFDSEMKKHMMAKQLKLEQLSKNAVKTTEKEVTRVWDSQQRDRQNVISAYKEEIFQDLLDLEKDVNTVNEAESKALVFFKQHLKTVHNCMSSQKERIQQLRKKQQEFQRNIEHIEASSNQNDVKEILQKEMKQLQQKILFEAQQQEIAHVKRNLKAILM